VLNLCANNYLGLANHPDIVAAAAREALDNWGYGLASVRFICGTQSIHKQLEERLSELPRHGRHHPLRLVLRCQRRPLRNAARCEDAIISDELNHASIIDGIRLCKATKYRYRNGDMEDLEAKLKEASGTRGIGSSRPTASSPWMATSPSSSRSAIWPTSTTRW
jgi:glycine C-acetyltransferase